MSGPGNVDGIGPFLDELRQRQAQPPAPLNWHPGDRASPNVEDRTGVQDDRQTVISADEARRRGEASKAWRQWHDSTPDDADLYDFQAGSAYAEGLRDLSARTKKLGAFDR
jgi:hypothetical protein